LTHVEVLVGDINNFFLKTVFEYLQRSEVSCIFSGPVNSPNNDIGIYFYKLCVSMKNVSLWFCAHPLHLTPQLEGHVNEPH
jgi:hypothetical protein